MDSITARLIAYGKDEPAMRVITIRMSPETHKQLKEAARRKRTSMNKYTLEMIEKLLIPYEDQDASGEERSQEPNGESTHENL